MIGRRHADTHLGPGATAGGRLVALFVSLVAVALAASVEGAGRRPQPRAGKLR